MSRPTFELTDPETGSNIAGSGAYTSGSNVFNLTANDYENDVLATSSHHRGLVWQKHHQRHGLDCTDPAPASRSDIYWFCLEKHTGVTSTSRLVYLADSWICTRSSLLPNSGDIAFNSIRPGCSRFRSLSMINTKNVKEMVDAALTGNSDSRNPRPATT